MPFTRESIRHPLAVRRAAVAAVRPLTPTMVRITLAGSELDGFVSAGPADHVKVFFPDPATGVLTAPTVTAEGTQRPAEGTIISRDYTPLAFRAEGDGPELDLDFVLHGDDGPASAWAARAEPGEQLAIAGPRGSRLVPPEMERLVIVADETALPATARWLRLAPSSVPVTGILDVADESVEDYFETGCLDTGYLDAEQRGRASFEWLYRRDGLGQLDEALRSLGPIDERTYVFLAGEATALIPLRRYLRRQLGLPADQVSASGYWKRGIVNLDHHTPLDPADPD